MIDRRITWLYARAQTIPESDTRLRTEEVSDPGSGDLVINTKTGKAIELAMPPCS